MSKILVFGHQNPDSDAIGSSYAFAYLAREAYGLDTEAVALGEPNEETAFVLDYFGVAAPRVITSAKAEGAEQVILTSALIFLISFFIAPKQRYLKLKNQPKLK